MTYQLLLLLTSPHSEVLVVESCRLRLSGEMPLEGFIVGSLVLSYSSRYLSWMVAMVHLIGDMLVHGVVH